MPNFNRNNTTIVNILSDLQHPHITQQLVDEIAKQFVNELQTEPDEVIYELIIHYCPELR